MNKLFPYKFYLSFWLYWLSSTLLYLLVLPFVSSLYATVIGPDAAQLPYTPLHSLITFVGLFTPVGIGSLFFSTGNTLLIITLLLVLSILFFDWITYKLFIRNFFLKIVFNLFFLLFLTFLFDHIIFGCWASYNLFMHVPTGLGACVPKY